MYIPSVLQAEEKKSFGLIFDGSSAKQLRLHEWNYDGKVLRGQGKLHVLNNKRFANYELRIRLKYLKEFGSLHINEVNLPEGKPSKETLDKLPGKWRDIRITVRNMPGEKKKMENLNPLGQGDAVVYAGNVVQLSPAHIRRNLKIGKNGYVIGKAERIGFYSNGPVEISHIEFLPLSPDSPRDYLNLTGEELKKAVAAGAEIYKVNCFNCHGDGVG
ncbi:unnamed protein product, partial [marine sediment metagenome]